MLKARGTMQRTRSCLCGRRVNVVLSLARELFSLESVRIIVALYNRSMMLLVWNTSTFEKIQQRRLLLVEPERVKLLC